jgi:hypothetical protein
MSGVGPTSDYDMLAHLVLLAIALKACNVEMVVMLGDDATIVLKRGSRLPDETIYYERQDSDEAMLRTLGLTCGRWMHPVGLNITIDSADKVLHYKQGDIIKNKMPYEERSQVAEFFGGSIRGEPVSEIIAKKEWAEGVYSPKEWLLSMTLE